MLTLQEELEQHSAGMGKIAQAIISYRLSETPAEATIKDIEGVVQCWGPLQDTAVQAKDWDKER